MIDQATIDRIISTARIEEVVGEFVTLRKRGANYIGLCPFHNERTPSFSVSPARGICKCFSCGKGGNAVHFIMEHEQLSYYAAIKWLGWKYGIEVKEREITDEERAAQSLRESLFAVHQFAVQYFQDTLYQHSEGQNIGLEYFRSRGFRDDIIKKFQLGYSLNQPAALAKEAVAKGYREEYLVQTGLCYRKDNGSLHDRFWGRVIFPVHSVSGNVVAFGGRVLNTATKHVQMKYVNSPESDIYHKSKELYGIYFAKQTIVKQNRCYLVEGYTDVISMHQSGIENVVSSSGTALTYDQIRLIHRFTEHITLLYDGDMAGIKASLRGIDMLLEEGMRVKVCLLPDGEDPDSFARKHNATEYQAYIQEHQTDFIQFKLQTLLADAQSDPLKRAELISSVVNSISVIPDDIVRSVYIQESSRLLQMEERILVKAVGDQIERRAEEKLKEREREWQRKQVASTPPPAEETSAPPPTDIPPAPLPSTEEGTAPAPSPAVPAPVTVEEKVKTKHPFFPIEKELMRLIVRYGEKKVLTVEDEETGETEDYNAIQYIIGSLQQDELNLHHPLFQRILSLLETDCTQPHFEASRYFLTHPEAEISQLGSQLLMDSHELSTYHTRFQKIPTDAERLPELLNHLLTDFKLKVLEVQIKETMRNLREIAPAGDASRSLELMTLLRDLQQRYNELSKQAGDRVVNAL